MKNDNKERSHHICPWYMAYLFDNPLRRIAHNPERILGQYVKPGMTVLDVGCGMGFFSLGMAKMVGPGGRVISLDIQSRMLEILKKRARRQQVLDRIETRLILEKRLPVVNPVDFALCFWMVHEVPDQPFLFRELIKVLKAGGYLLIAEPGMGHVKDVDMEETVRTAMAEGFSMIERPHIRLSMAVVLKNSV